MRRGSTRWGMGWAAAALAVAAVAGTAGRGASDDAPAAPAHLVWAENLVATLEPQNNLYGSPAAIAWKGVDGPVSTNVSVCSTFVSTLLKRAYNLTELDLKAWFGSKSPSAALFHDTILQAKGFTPVPFVGQLRAGDVIAVAYRDGSDNTGHVMVASSTPVDKGVVTVSGAPLRLYEVTVIDSSSSYHGKLDTRYVRKDGTNPDNGVGEGWFRIYADPATDAIAGYSWSSVNGSVFYPQPAPEPSAGGRHLVIGRL